MLYAPWALGVVGIQLFCQVADLAGQALTQILLQQALP